MVRVVKWVICPGGSYSGHSCPGGNRLFHMLECPRIENVLGWQLSCDVYPRGIYPLSLDLNCRLMQIS